MTLREARALVEAERRRVVAQYGEIPEGATVFLPRPLVAQAGALDLCGFTVAPTDDARVRFAYAGPAGFTL